MTQKANFMSWNNPGLALITGASAGIGVEFANQLAEQGFDLILIARRQQKLDNLSKELQETYSIDAEVLVADLSILDESYKIVSKILNLNNLDVLVNNAGYGINKTFFETDVGQHIEMINVHLTSSVMFCHAVIPNMLKRKRGVIINTSSTAAINKSQMGVMYTTTKTALTVFSEVLQESIKDTGIFIQSLCPGFTYSEFHDTETMRGFQRTWFPKESWMESKDVVSISLEAVKNKEVIVIPGELNQKNAKRIRKAAVEQYLSGKRL